ncbi:MAG: phosphotransferase family protein [Candidatus Spyradocola sp.]
MEGLKKLGTGRTAEAFLTEDGRVLKLFYAGYPKDSVEKELRNAGMVDALGVPAPRCFGSVTMDGRVGIVYERAAGESLLSVLLRTGDVEGCARVMVELQGKMLACEMPGEALDARDFLRQEIRRNGKLPEEKKAEALARLEALPGGNRLCHGDFHPDNVMVDGSRAMVIDWMNLCRGDAMYDVAMTWYLLACSALPPDAPYAEGLAQMRGRLADEYLRQMGVEKAQIEGWLPVIRASRFEG